MCPALSTDSLLGGHVGYFCGSPKGQMLHGWAACGGKGLDPSKPVQERRPCGITSCQAVEGLELSDGFPVSAMPSGEHCPSFGGSCSVL